MSSASAIESRELAMLDSLVTSLVETRSAIAAMQALELTLLAAAEALADEQTSRLAAADAREAEMPRRTIAAEIGTATRANDRTVQRRMGEASALTRDFPEVVSALGSGRIERSHAAVILDTGGSMTDAAARADFERAAVSLAERETPGRLRSLLRSLAARLDPMSIDFRHSRAKERRGVWVQDLDDGMAQLIATLPAAVAHAIRDRLTRFAHVVIDARETASASDWGVGAGEEGATVHEAERAVPEAEGAVPDAGSVVPEGVSGAGPADRRSIEQVRADVLADLLLSGDPTAAPRSPTPIVGTVQVVVPVLTLIGVGEEPAEIVGHAPIDAATARRLAGSAPGWDRILTHPVTSAVLAVDRYRPSEDQRRMLRARDERCRFPGCRMPVHRCDIDHTIDAARGGPTETCNLAHLCRRHHTLKHASDWTVRQRADGTLEWASPTGRIHLDEPPSAVRFRATADPPAF